jgi:hypothetical protein
MTKFFPDKLNDLIFHKPTKRFTDEEKLIIDNLINTILREDKKSEITASKTNYPNVQSTFRSDYNEGAFGDEIKIRVETYITEEISKSFIFKGKPFFIGFNKSYPERAWGPDGKRIQIIAASQTFYDEFDGDYTVTVDLEYDKNNCLTPDTKKKIENDFCKVIIKLINNETKT